MGCRALMQAMNALAYNLGPAAGGYRSLLYIFAQRAGAFHKRDSGIEILCLSCEIMLRGRDGAAEVGESDDGRSAE